MKKILTLTVVLCILSAVLAITPFAVTDFTGYTAISDAEGLLALMNSSSAVTGKYYLTQDIDLSGKTQSPIGEPNGKSFGTKTSPAVFDGNGHTVKGVNISGADYVGFFGVVDNAEIRNLTIEGKISATKSHCGGIVAYAKTMITIENCTNKCTVESSSTNVGGILGNNELVTGNPIKKIIIKNCTNEGSVKAARVVGGIVGVINRTANCEILIESCTNNGKISATSTSAESKAGGIIGASNRGDASTPIAVSSFKISKCRNTADISGYFTLGGIAGEFYGTDSSSSAAYSNAKYSVTECMNSGKITASRTTKNEHSYVGGIIGKVSQIGNIADCLNTGDIYVKLDYAGGLFGHCPQDFLGAKNNLNRATVYLNNSTSGGDYVNSIGGFLIYKPYGTNYYTGTRQGKEWVNGNAKSTEYKQSLFSNLNESGNWTNPEEPVLIVFVDLLCEHGEVEFKAKGTSVEFVCTSCGEPIYTDTTILSEVYVSNASGILANAGRDIGTQSAPFKSLNEAFEYVAIAAEIKNSNAKITILDKGVLEDTYETPKTAKTITVTGGTFHFGGAKIANRHLNLGGPAVFENITFTSAATEVRINAQNNKLVMGEGIVMGNATSTTKVNSSIPFAVNDVKMFVSGGFYENVPAEMNTDVTVRSGEYYIITGFNCTNSKDATKGTSRITVGKTNDGDVLKICDVVAFSTVAQTRLTADSTATVIIDGKADIARIIMSEREMTTNTVSANYITHLILKGSVSESYRNTYMAPYGVDITGGAHGENSLGYHTFRIFTDSRVEDSVLLEHAFFGGDGYEIDSTLVTGGYKPASNGGDVTLTGHSYMEYCIEFLGGHTDGDDSDTLCDECGADVNCTHENANTVIERESDCTTNGYYTKLCSDCGIMVDEGDLPLENDAHSYVWEAFDGGYRYVCTNNASHVYCTYDKKVTEFFVSDNGKADGGFSASYPSNDFDSIMRLAAANNEDVTVYILGEVTLPDNDTTTYEVYLEPEHSNTVTVCGYKDTIGIIRTGTRNARLEYVLSGDTTFRQIEFNTGITKNSLYIVARHNRLVMDENISASFNRYNGDSTSNSGKLILIGGCDNTFDSSACSKTDTHITVKSGTYYMIIGGSSSKACGLKNGTVNIDVLGDITVGGVVTNENGYVDRQFILGSHSANAGDINLTVDGNVTCINALCVGSYGVYTSGGNSVCRTAKNVTITIKSGSLTDYSFSGRSDSAIIYTEEFAQSYDPTANQLETATAVIFPLGNSHHHIIRGGVMTTLDSLKVFYNANKYSAVHLADRFRLSLGAADNFSMAALPDAPCTSASGMHTALGGGEVVLEATCKGEGSVKYTCADCGKTYTESIARKAHDFGESVLFRDADCISPKVYVSTCENADCGFKNYEASGAPTGVHTFEDGICKYCLAAKEDLCEHIYDDGTEITTGCGEGKLYTCTLGCGKTKTVVTGASHNFGKYTVTSEPTETTPGVKTRKCKSCGMVETALLYSDGDSAAAEAIATNLDGTLADVSLASLKLSKAEREVLEALLGESTYGAEIKISYNVSENVTDVIYSIPLPAEYADMQNIKVVVKDDDGTLHYVDFKIEKGYIVFTF